MLSELHFVRYGKSSKSAYVIILLALINLRIYFEKHITQSIVLRVFMMPLRKNVA